MPDDKKKQGNGDRAQVAAAEPYEVAYFADKHGIAREQAQGLIDRIGNDRTKLDAAAVRLSRPARKTALAKPKAVSHGPAGKADAAPATAGKSLPKAATRRKARIDSASATTAAALTTAVADTVTPVMRRGAAAARTATKVAKRTTDQATKKISAAPSATRTAVGTAVESVKAAVTGRTAGLVGLAAAGVVTGLAANLARKAIVQAPSALAGDWLEALKVEHRLALGLFDLIQATGNEDTGKRTTLLVQLKHALGKHAFTEENVIYPALRTWGDKADADKLNHDHGYVKQYLYELEALDNGSPAFLEKIAAFRADLEAHIKEEESAIFPPLHAALGDAGNARVTALANKEGFKLA